MLCATDIYKKYDAPVLRGVTLEASPGEIVGIAGANGSGKSTLLSIITSITKPDKGTVTLDGQPVTMRKVRENIGFAAQDEALFGRLSVEDNLRFWAAAQNTSFDKSIYDPSFLRKKVDNLSGGMRRRLSLIIAQLHNPLYLIMDEPTAELDIYYRGEVMRDIRHRKDLGKSVLMTTHNMHELLLCDRIYIINNGEFAYEGPPANLGHDEQSFTASMQRILNYA